MMPSETQLGALGYGLRVSAAPLPLAQQARPLVQSAMAAAIRRTSPAASLALLELNDARLASQTLIVVSVHVSVVPAGGPERFSQNVLVLAARLMRQGTSGSLIPAELELIGVPGATVSSGLVDEACARLAARLMR